MRLMRAFIPALLVLAMLAAPTPSPAAVSIGISVGIAPPPLPIYEQPPIPGPGYLWTPGYWAWGPDYYWVPGTWVYPPTIGFLWTPPWWGWSNGVYVFNAGYWGPHIGFYGGINYGFGYFGRGYDGGYWDHGRFFYNREVNNVRNVNITNVYSRPVENRGENRVAFNGGNGGVSAGNFGSFGVIHLVFLCFMDIAGSSNPVISLVPNRSTRRAEFGASNKMAADCGIRMAPARSGEKPCTDWMYCVIRNTVPNRAISTVRSSRQHGARRSQT